jgi:hypothetical protein
MGGSLSLVRSSTKGAPFGFEIPFMIRRIRRRRMLSIPFLLPSRLPNTGRQGRAGVLGFSGARVLLAEDNPSSQDVTRKMLEMMGCRVHVVNDGSTLWRLFLLPVSILFSWIAKCPSWTALPLRGVSGKMRRR